ncbi:SRPBCC domain-containing protein [Brumimicrobium glaciale]|uniref:SRPBCC domain-containing protein n=1 Tax=Brumimicrobium glaciale TaxID=200475 RepID=UPI001F5C1104|nr:SRPBCC domain-containing protein [Brumimicrobium glaciale]
MTKEIKTEIVINSSKERIWEVLTNFKEYPVWNPFIQSITGKIEIGEKLKVKIVPPNSKGMIFNPTVLALEKGTKLCWL